MQYGWQMTANGMNFHLYDVQYLVQNRSMKNPQLTIT